MAKYNYYQNSFSAGELSPKLRGRLDSKEYVNGAEILQNMIVMPSGGATRRPGSRFKYRLTDLFVEPIIIPFIRNKKVAYNIVLENNHKSTYITLPESTDVGASYDNINEITITSGTIWETGTPVVFDRGSATPQNYYPYEIYFVIKVSATKFKLALTKADALAGTAFTFGSIASGVLRFNDNLYAKAVFDVNGNLLNIDNQALYMGSTDGELDQYGYNWTQVGDVILVTHQSKELEPFVIKRISETRFALNTYKAEAYSRIGDIPFSRPFQDINSDEELYLHPSATTGTITVTSKFSSGNSRLFFEPTHTDVIFMYWDLASTTSYGTFRINTVGNTKSIVPTDITTGVGTSNINKTSHGFITGDEVSITQVGTGTMPLPLRDGKIYYVIRIDADNFQLAETFDLAIATTEINFNTAGTATSYTITLLRTSVVSAAVVNALPTAVTSNIWQEEAWSSRMGYPATVTSYEQKAVFGGTKIQMDTLFFSKTGNIWMMYDDAMSVYVTSVDYEPTAAFQATIASDEANEITWMKASSVLLIGTLGAEYVCSGGQEAISRENISIKPQTELGGKGVKPVLADRFTLFISRDGKTLRAYTYNEENGSFIPKNVSVLSDHLVYFNSTSKLDAEYVKLQGHASKDITWILTSSNQLIGLTWHENTLVTAWHRHVLGGEDVKILDMSVLPNSDGTFDYLWLIVSRTINSVTETYLECIGTFFEEDEMDNDISDDDAKSIFVDSAIRIVEGSPTDTFTGLDHLEGEEVVVLADNSTVYTSTVTGGQIVLVSNHTEVIVGLSNTPIVLTTKIDAGVEDRTGSARGNTTRIHRATVALHKTGKALVGYSATALEEAEFTPDTDIYSGDVNVDFPASPDRYAQVYITSDEPKPLTVLSVGMKGVTYEQ